MNAKIQYLILAVAIFVAIGIAGGSYLLGYKHAAAKGQAEIGALREDYAHKQQETEAAARAQEQEWQTRLTEAINERDQKNQVLSARNDELAASIERMRVTVTAQSSSRRMSAASGAACKTCAVQLASCKRFLLEGAELLREGSALAGDIAADKDAITKVKEFH